MATNSDIKAQHDIVLATVNTLSGQMDTITDPTEAKKIMLEMQQLTSRANLLQSLLLVAQTAEISQQTQKVTDAKADLDKDIKEDASWSNIVSGINSLLTVVDETIQLAKESMI
jgi:hypothetical protein